MRQPMRFFHDSGEIRLHVRKFETRRQLGTAAAEDVSAAIRQLLEEKEEINMIFAAAPSQSEFLEALRTDTRIDFSRIRAFHMDEYIGLPADAPQGFGNFLRERLFARVPFRAVEYLDCTATDAQAECERYAALLQQYPVDIVCLGIGENGHIAFNDPHVADFADKQLVKRVQLDETCRNQQVHDGCFASLSQVPTHAMTLTIPALAAARLHFCMVPAATKAQAVHDTLYGPLSESCPASILRTCPQAVIYLDAESGGLL
ncbi:MAG: glucosamine-6-phosphate deaminase [Provencibacterium sp.]|nr:glucosamine-6-phosphate deaminase [Provencibacterium sp.]